MWDHRVQVGHLGSGNFGVCQLMVDLTDGEYVAVKFLPRGNKVGAERPSLKYHVAPASLAVRGWGRAHRLWVSEC